MFCEQHRAAEEEGRRAVSEGKEHVEDNDDDDEEHELAEAQRFSAELFASQNFPPLPSHLPPHLPPLLPHLSAWAEADDDEDEEEEVDDEHAQLHAEVQQLEALLRASQPEPHDPSRPPRPPSLSSHRALSSTRSSSTSASSSTAASAAPSLPTVHPFDTLPPPSFKPHSVLTFPSSTPLPSLSSLQSALQRNEAYQEELQESLAAIVARLTELDEMERLLLSVYQHSSIQMVGATSASALSSALSPYQTLPRSALFSFPHLIAPTQHTSPTLPNPPSAASSYSSSSSSPSASPFPSSSSLLRTHPVRHRAVAWSEDERQSLELGIQHTNQLHAMRSALSTLSPSSPPTLAQQTIASVRAQPPASFLSDYSRVDWQLMASDYVPGRTAAAIRQMWVNGLDPRINHLPWTPAEDDWLVRGVKAASDGSPPPKPSSGGAEGKAGGGEGSWVGLAAGLGTSRTAWQCFCRYVRSLSGEVISALPFSAVEDERLRVLVEEEEGSRDWMRISRFLPGRTEQQVMHRYLKVLQGRGAKAGKGPWRVLEDLRLRLAVLSCNLRWSEVSKGVGHGRSDVSCRERWMNALRPGVAKHKGWTKEEVELLCRLQAEMGDKGWKAVSEQMEGRTEKQCMKKWKRIQSQATKTKQRPRPSQVAGEVVEDAEGKQQSKEEKGEEEKKTEEGQKEEEMKEVGRGGQQVVVQQPWLYTGYRRRQGNEVTLKQGRGRKRRDHTQAMSPQDDLHAGASEKKKRKATPSTVPLRPLATGSGETG